MANQYLVLYAGCISSYYNYPRYRNDLSRMARALSGLSGSSAARTRLLFAEGGAGLDVSGEVVTAAPATSDHLRAVVEELGGLMAPEDVFVFVASNHGARTRDEQRTSLLCCWGNDGVLAPTLANWCGTIPSRRQIYILGQCYSGGFVPSLTAPERIIMTASQADEPSWATADGTYDEFLLRIIEALEARAVTYQSVWDYARNNDRRQEHPQFDDPGHLAQLQGLLPWL